MVTTHPIELTQLESLYLSDALSMFAQGPPDDTGQGAPYPNLLLKIGGAVLETAQSNTPVKAHLSLAEFWVIREVAKSSVVVGNERVGLSLLLKAYEGLRALAADSDIQRVVDDIGEVTEFEPGKADYAAQLAELKDYQKAGEGSDDSKEDVNESVSEHNKPDDADKDRADYNA